MKTLRTDQRGAIDKLDQLLMEGKRRIVIQAPTGYGKTLVAAELINRELEQGKRVIFCVPAISLIDQTVESFWKQGIRDIGVMQALHEMTNWDMPVQVCSVQTLLRRNIPPAGFVIIDECHRWFKFYEKWLLDPSWQDIPIVGLSATPWTKGLGAYYSDLIVANTTEEMIESGHLSDFKVFAPSSPDLTGVRTLAGDYHEGDLSKAMDKAPLVADIVDTWLQRGEGRPTLCFAVDRAHAKSLQQQFLAKGVPADYQDQYTRDDERSRIKMRFHCGETKVVCNVGTLTTGVDWDVRCIILARPTKSEMLFVQIVGRGLRRAEGKDYCLILDHSDNHLRLGFVTDIKHNFLNDGSTPVSTKLDSIRLPKKCPKCTFILPRNAKICPACGTELKVVSTIRPVDGELQEMKRSPKSPANPLVWVNKCEVYRQLRGIALSHGYKKGWAYFKYREKYNENPPWNWNDYPPMQPDPEVVNWIKSRMIAWSKRRADRGAASNV